MSDPPDSMNPADVAPEGFELTAPPATEDEFEEARRLSRARKARAFLEQLARRGRPKFAVEAEAKLAREENKP